MIDFLNLPKTFDKHVGTTENSANQRLCEDS
jgi:hypothetical protein